MKWRAVGKALVNVVSNTHTQLFENHLFATNVMLSFLFYGSADVTVQKYTNVKAHTTGWNQKQTLNVAIAGVPCGIISHGTFKYLELWFPGQSLADAFKKYFIHQIVFSPVSIVAFFFTIGYLNGQSTQVIYDETISKGKDLLVADFIIGTPTSLLNFYYLPYKYRGLYDNTVSFVYDLYSVHVLNQ